MTALVVVSVMMVVMRAVSPMVMMRAAASPRMVLMVPHRRSPVRGVVSIVVCGRVRVVTAGTAADEHARGQASDCKQAFHIVLGRENATAARAKLQ